MSDRVRDETSGSDLLDAVERSQRRKLRSRGQRPEIARGLGSSGVVGWSIAVPTLVGIAVGVWLDRRVDSDYSWTLVLLAVGLVVGGLTAWYWVKRELEHDE